MLVFYPFCNRNEQSYGCLSRTELQPLAYYFNDIFIVLACEEIMCFHKFDYFIDFLQFQYIFFSEVEWISAIDNRIDGVFEINKKILLRILAQQDLLNHIVIQHLTAQLFIHFNQLANHLFMYRVQKSLEIEQLLLLEIEVKEDRVLVIKGATTSLILIVLGSDQPMYIWLPLAALALNLQPTKILYALLQKMSFAHSFRTYYKGQVISSHPASRGGRVEKPYQKVVELRVLMHFECNFLLGLVLEIQEEGRLYF